MSRLSNVRAAVRPSLRARLLFSGASGTGKTRTSLITAERLSKNGTILVIDTEKESALTYADDFRFDHLSWNPPFDPRELAAALTEAGETYDVVVVDSLSHFWRGDGGTLDIADGKFTGWKVARAAQDDLVAAILNCKAHVILCARAKVEHVQEQDPKTGKHVVRKLGMSSIQDDTLEYELNVAAELNIEHELTISKSRCVTVPVGRTFAPGHAADFADLYREWLAGGEPMADASVMEALVAQMNGLAAEQRKSCKREFVAKFGPPDRLPVSRLAAAREFVEGFVKKANADEDPGQDEASAAATDTGPDVEAETEPKVDNGRQLAMGRLFKMLDEFAIADDSRHDWASEQLDRTIESFAELSDDEIVQLTHHLQDSQIRGAS